MKRVTKVVFIIILVAVIGGLSAAYAADSDKVGDDLNATDNLTEAEQIATEQNKDIFVVFKSDVCGWCDRLEQETLADERIISQLDEKYVTAIIDIDKQPDVAEAYNVAATPVMLFLDNNGTEKARLNGFYGPQELVEYM